MVKKQVDKNHLKKQRDIERQYEQFFIPFPYVLINPEGSLAQPSPYLNIWGLQASDAGEEPVVEDSSPVGV